ncbi:MAG: hypothetical protein R2698_02045 [Microthrixaceae bacterium]
MNVAVAVWSVAKGAPGATVPLAAMSIWLLAGAAPLLVAAATRAPGFDDPPTGRTNLAEAGSAYAVIVLLGDQPRDVAATTVALAASTAPTVVAITGDAVAVDHDDRERDRRDFPDATIAYGATPDAAIVEAAATIAEATTLLVSARAFPRHDRCRGAASLIGDGPGVLIAVGDHLDVDDLVVTDGDGIDSALRTAARQEGLTMWEQDGVMTSTRLLRERPPAPDAPLGTWLRSLAVDDVAGYQVARALSTHLAPSDAADRWSESARRASARALELRRAVADGWWKTRLLAAALLVRECYAPFALGALALPVYVLVTGQAPWSGSSGRVGLVVVTWLSVRWALLRLILRVRTRPVDDALDAVRGTGASLIATAAALTGRPRPRRAERRRHGSPVRSHRRPTSVVAASVTAVGIVAALYAGDVTPWSGAIALVALTVLWTLVLGGLVESNRRHTRVRVPLRLHAELDSRPVRLVEGSTEGVRVEGDRQPPEVGARLDLLIAPDHAAATQPTHGWIRTTAHVRHLRTAIEAGDSWSAGCRLSLVDTTRARWAAVLYSAAVEAVSDPVRLGIDAGPGTRAGEARIGTTAVLRGLATMVAVLASVTVAALSVTIASGYRPMVVESATMSPTYRPGDLAILAPTDPVRLRVGDPVVRSRRDIERVVSIRSAAHGYRVESSGDAEGSTRRWTVGRNRSVLRVVWSIPWVGAPLGYLREQPLAAVAAVVALAVLVYASATARRGEPDRRSGVAPPDR